MIHQFDPHMAPDSEFQPGELKWLVPGNRGRLLDRRRTPVQIERLDLATGQFVCRIMGFEDRGAVWEIPLESVGSYQFARDSRAAGAAEVARYAEAAACFDREVEFPCDPGRRARTLGRLDGLRLEAGRWLEERSGFFRAAGRLDPEAQRGDERLWADLEGYMRERGLLELESSFAARYVSNPQSGEWVKAHRMVIAELGLAPYRGKVLRDPAAFEGVGSRAARAEHVLRRLAFVHQLFVRSGDPAPTLYRGLSAEGPLEPRRPGTFVSATFRLEAAMSLFGGPRDGTGALYRQAVPAERLFMTFFETRAMNERFLEAEAVLVEDEANPAF